MRQPEHKPALKLPDRRRPLRDQEDLLNTVCPVCNTGRLFDVSPNFGPRLVRCNQYDCGAFGPRFN